MSKRTVLVLLALAAVAALCAAQDTSLAVEKIVVTATRIAGTILASPDHITVVSGEELAGALSAAEALEGVSGVSVSDNGAVGAVQSVSLRGSAAAQVLVLVDGVRLNDSRQGAPDLSQIPVDNIERIEIVRGGTSALYGADAVAGVVNIITKSRSEDRFRLSLTSGGYLPSAALEAYDYNWGTFTPVTAPVQAEYLDLVDTQRIAAQLSQGLGPADLMITGSFTRANNGFVWNDQKYLGEYRRIEGPLLEADGSLSLTAPTGQGRVGLKGQVGYSDFQPPGLLNPTFLPTDATQRISSFQAQAFFQSDRLGSSSLTLDSHLFYKYSRLEYVDPATFTDADHRLHTLGLEASQKLTAADWLQLVYGGNLLFDTANSTLFGRKNRVSGGVFLEAPLYLLSWLTLTPMARYDMYTDFPASLTYKLAAVAALSESVSLKASGARSYRAPTLNDLYWNESWAVGNPDLEPETGYTGELGITVVRGRLESNLFAFARYVLNGIEWDWSVSPGTPINIGEALFPGVEADVAVQLLPGLRLSGGYVFLYSFVLKGASAVYTFADDKRARYSPVHKADLAASYQRGPFQVGAQAEYVGERFAEEANTVLLDPYILLNADVRLQVNPHLRLSLAGKNLLNQVYQTVNDSLMPPLSFWVGAELTL
jgi:outer membrane cobalamin receptor